MSDLSTSPFIFIILSDSPTSTISPYIYIYIYIYIILYFFNCPVDWGCKIHRLHLWRGIRPLQRVSCYDTKQSDGEVPVMQELWDMQNIPSLSSLPDPLWPRVETPDRVISMSQTELNCVLMLNWIVWNRIVCCLNCVLMLN